MIDDRKRMLARIGRLVGGTRRASRRYGVSMAAVSSRVLRLWLRNGMRPSETLRHGLADPALDEGTLSMCMGRRRFNRLQKKVNPTGLEYLLRDKGAFYPYCLGLGLPVPRLRGVFDLLGGWSVEGRPLLTNQEWEEFFRDVVPSEFVVKPARGGYGSCFQLLTREGDGFRDAHGKLLSASDLIASMRDHRVYRRWVIQDRLRNHPDLDRLTGSTYLQTARMITLVGADGVARLFTPYLKMIAGTAVNDNIQGGRSGNFPVGVRLDGALLAPRAFDGDGVGMSPVTVHPRTGIPLEGVRLPFWDDALRLVERAACLFLPVRAIGWDVAFTPTGAVIVEGNFPFDPPNHLIFAPPADKQQDGAMGQLVDTLRLEARRPARSGLERVEGVPRQSM